MEQIHGSGDESRGRHRQPHVVILGAGPVGVGAAFRLTQLQTARVTLLEQNAWVGGNAASFDLAGLRVDFGSHRLHPACDPDILQDIRTLLGEDLLQRPRRGRIRLHGRWLRFPLRPLDLVLRLPPRFVSGVASDAARKLARRRVRPASPQNHQETFAAVLEAGLGRTICRGFYFPYARKIWGHEPAELSAVQAYRRVSSGSLAAMLGRIVWPKLTSRTARSSYFLYPRRGYGQISEAYARAAYEAGADIRLNCKVTSIELGKATPHRVTYTRGGQTESLECDYLWSSAPITTLARLVAPAPPPQVLAAAEHIKYRSLILVYLVLETDRFGEWDAYYFPEASVPMSRVSEPKNFSGSSEPRNLTVLCAELPCSSTSPQWHASDEELGRLVWQALAACGLPARAPIKYVMTRRLRHAYPIYLRGFEAHLAHLDAWLDGIDGLLSFGRQGMFSHDNLHHALYIGYSAADCLDPSGAFNRQRWRDCRRIFETHVVED